MSNPQLLVSRIHKQLATEILRLYSKPGFRAPHSPAPETIFFLAFGVLQLRVCLFERLHHEVVAPKVQTLCTQTAEGSREWVGARAKGGEA